MMLLLNRIVPRIAILATHKRGYPVNKTTPEAREPLKQ